MIRIRKYKLIFISAAFLLFCNTVVAKIGNADSLRQLLKKDLPDSLKLKYNHELAYIFLNINPDTCERYTMQALKFLDTTKNSSALSFHYKLLGAIYRYRSNLRMAEFYFNKSLKALKGVSDIKLLSSAYNNLGLINWDLGNYVTARNYMEKSLQIAEYMKDSTGTLSTLLNLGLLTDYEGKIDVALDYYAKTLLYCRNLRDLESEALVHSNVGIIREKQKLYHEARNELLLSIVQCKITGNYPVLALAYANMGIVAHNTNDREAAYAYLDSAWIEGTKIGQKAILMNCLLSKGNWYLEEGKVVEGFKLLNRCYEYSKEVGSKNYSLNITQSLSDNYAKHKDFRKAYQFQELYHAYDDSIASEESERTQLELKSQLNLRKKDKEYLLIEKAREVGKMEQGENRKRFNLLILLSVIGTVLLGMFLLYVYKKYRINVKINKEISRQKSVLEQQNLELHRSILFANKIQKALIASEELLNRLFPAHFVFHQPKDIVSGDFYWAAEQNGKTFLALGDCTGHGVSGAFMSLLNITLLKELVLEKKISSPELILNSVRESIIQTLNPEGSAGNTRDGMDAVLCVFDSKNRKLNFACANISLWLIRNNELKIFKADKMPVGMYAGENKTFRLQEIDLLPGDRIVLYSDGFPDQFGMEGKKFKSLRFSELILSLSSIPQELHHEKVATVFEDWKGNVEQTDDVTVIEIYIQ